MKEDTGRVIFQSEMQREIFAMEWEEARNRLKESGYNLSKIIIVPKE